MIAAFSDIALPSPYAVGLTQPTSEAHVRFVVDIAACPADVRFTAESRHMRRAGACPLSANSGLEVIKPFQEMARFDRCQLPATLESGVALLAGATSPPFYGEKQRSLSPRV